MILGAEELDYGKILTKNDKCKHNVLSTSIYSESAFADFDIGACEDLATLKAYATCRDQPPYAFDNSANILISRYKKDLTLSFKMAPGKNVWS